MNIPTLKANPAFVAHNFSHLPPWETRYIDIFLTWDKEKYDSKSIEILSTAFGQLADSIANVEFVTNLIQEVSNVVEGKRERTGWVAMDSIYSVDIYKDATKVANMDYLGELPTPEIYELLKDWLEFLKEYYKRAFVPLEWIKPEFLEKAKELQIPNNGLEKEKQDQIVYQLSDGKSGTISDLVNQIENQLFSKSYSITQIDLSSFLDKKLEGLYISSIEGFENNYVPEKTHGHLLFLEGRDILIITEGNFGQLKSGNFGFGKYLLKAEPYQTENNKTGEKYNWLGLKMQKDGENVWKYGGEYFAIAKEIKAYEISGIKKEGEEKTVANLFVYKQNNS